MSDQYTGASPSAETGQPLSVTDTLSGIIFEPGRVFESFRAHPRFLIAGLIIIACVLAFQVSMTQRLGYENIVRSQIESRAPDMDPAQREQQIEMQTKPVFKVIGMIAPVIFFVILFAAGAGLYLLGTLAMGKSMNFKQALSVWIYSSLPPTIVFTVVNLLLLFLRSPEDIDVASASRGLARANLGILVDGAASPVLATALGSIDLIGFYGLFLAALGIRKISRLSSGASWTIVLGIWFVGVIVRLALAAVLKTPMA